MTYRPYPTREEWEADAAGFASFLRQDETPDARLADYAPTDPDSIFGKTPMEISLSTSAAPAPNCPG